MSLGGWSIVNPVGVIAESDRVNFNWTPPSGSSENSRASRLLAMIFNGNIIAINVPAINDGNRLLRWLFFDDLLVMVVSSAVS